MLPQIRKYIDEIKKKPTIASFSVLSDACADNFLEAKLEFFKSVAVQLEPFLKKFQSRAPLSPLLFDHLTSILRGLLDRFVTSTGMKNIKTAKDLVNIDLSNLALFKPVLETDVGFGAKRKTPRTASDRKRHEFFATGRTFLIETIKKLLERSPIKYSLVRGLASINPSSILASSATAQKRFDVALEHLLTANRITTSEADKAKNEFAGLCTTNTVSAKLRSYDEAQRLDHFWYELVGVRDNCTNMWKCIQMLLLLSHGNAIVESGFSVNESLLVEKLHDQSPVAQRGVMDAIKTAGGVLKVAIDKDMLRHVKSGHSRYKQALENRRLVETEKARAENERKRKAKEIAQLEKEKDIVEQDMRTKRAALESRIACGIALIRRISVYEDNLEMKTGVNEYM